MKLSRVLEPEVMDSLQEALDYDDMDHRVVNKAFVDDLLSHHPRTSDVLDLGTGTARIPIELCRRDEGARVYAIDLSSDMLDVARNNIEIAELTDRIVLDRIDAKVLPFPDQHFTTLISNSIVHHIPEPLDVLREAIRVTQSGGLVFIRDLMRPDDESEVQRLVDTYTEGENDHARKMFDDSLRAALHLDEMRSLAEKLGFATDTVQATSDRHWTWRVTP